MAYRYFYAVFMPRGIVGDKDNELHRFTRSHDRDAWVSLDPKHRAMVCRRDGIATYEAFQYTARDQMWETVDSHELYVGVQDGAISIGAAKQRARRLTAKQSVRGDGSLVVTKAYVGGVSHSVTWVTTPNDTAIIVEGITTLVFQGKLDDSGFDRYVRTIIADAKYDSLVQHEKWQGLYDSVTVGNGAMLSVA